MSDGSSVWRQGEVAPVQLRTRNVAAVTCGCEPAVCLMQVRRTYLLSYAGKGLLVGWSPSRQRAIDLKRPARERPAALRSARMRAARRAKRAAPDFGHRPRSSAHVLQYSVARPRGSASEMSASCRCHMHRFLAAGSGAIRFAHVAMRSAPPQLSFRRCSGSVFIEYRLVRSLGACTNTRPHRRLEYWPCG